MQFDRSLFLTDPLTPSQRFVVDVLVATCLGISAAVCGAVAMVVAVRLSQPRVQLLVRRDAGTRRAALLSGLGTLLAMLSGATYFFVGFAAFGGAVLAGVALMAFAGYVIREG